jgi:hypothetical protein
VRKTEAFLRVLCPAKPIGVFKADNEFDVSESQKDDAESRVKYEERPEKPVNGSQGSLLYHFHLQKKQKPKGLGGL